MRIKMTIIEEPDPVHREIIDRGTSDDPVIIHGSGPHSFLCAACSVVLVEGVRFGQIESVSIRCAACGTLNAIPRVMGGDGTPEPGR